MKQIYDVTWRKEIDGEKVLSEDKIFSIYEQHTDIIVKGQREALFGHKINLAAGKSNLVLDCQVLRGNPSDKLLFKPTIDNVIQNYGVIPRDSTTDGGYASLANQEHAQKAGISNIVFNKVVGSMQNIVSSFNMETRLRKWSSAMEAIISNIKRGFNIFTCNWKGWIHFQAKVIWSILAYNFRVMTGLILARIKPAPKGCGSPERPVKKGVLNNDPVNGTKKMCEKNQNPAVINKMDRDINRILALLLLSDGFCSEKSLCASKK